MSAKWELPRATLKHTVRSVARRWRALDQEVHNLDELIEPLVCKAAPALLAWPDVGSDVAASLLLAAGRQPWTSA